MAEQEKGKLREFNLRTPVKVKFTRGELIDWTNAHFGAQVDNEQYQAYLNGLLARRDENGYMDMKLSDLVECMRREIKDHRTVGDILVADSDLRTIEKSEPEREM